MPKVKIDYSNTIFYKIYCKDPSVKELYIGHTTNFVQRKHAHKQGCINTKHANYNCKVYKIIRDNMGWDNWTMEIIAFHNCEDLYSAKKQEQHYFEEYKATLNSIEPLPPPKPKKEFIINPPKEVLYCNSCRVHFNTRKLQEEHNKRPRHLKMKQSETTNNTIFSCEDTMKTKFTHKTPCKFNCNLCEFKSSNKKDYNRHLSTTKHKLMINNVENTPKPPLQFICECGRQYKHRQGLHFHRKSCNIKKIDIECTSSNISQPIDTNIIVELLKQNKELHKLVIDLAKNSNNTINNTTTNNTTNNNRFNLNVFLNETCKDAINLNDFIQSIELTINDFINTGEVGYVKGISNIMVERIRDMEPHIRPIHCTDIKRETVYVKDSDKWEKEDENKTHLRKAIRIVADKNKVLVHSWREDNPNYDILDTPECNKFFEYTKASLGGYGKEEDERFENKIIHNILKETVIHKETIE